MSNVLIQTHGSTLVVGGTKGTGLLIARRLLSDGGRVRVLARDPEQAGRELPGSVEICPGDLTRPGSLLPVVENVANIVFTAGAPSGRYAPEDLVRRTDYEGVVSTIDAAKGQGFAGRFLYLNSMGIKTPSVAGTLINLLKRNTLVWRRRVEDQIRTSGLDYTIIRIGFLSNRSPGERDVVLSQGALPLSFRRWISRGDVAEAFVAALHHPRASRATFEIAWGKGPCTETWVEKLDHVQSDRSL